jgi:hypothetical protein
MEQEQVKKPFREQPDSVNLNAFDSFSLKKKVVQEKPFS